MGDIGKRYTTKDIAEMLQVEAVTIRKYALALEKAGYSIDRADGKNRSYSDKDAMAFKYLQSIRSRTSITVEEAATLIVQRNNTDTDSGSSIVRSDGEALYDQYDQRYDLLAAKVEQLIAIQQVAAAALPSPEEQRAQRIDERLLERKVERQLEREALELWDRKPEAERMRKVGWFRYEENVGAQKRFVREYVDDNYETRIREAYEE